jgi:hypothetical protein
VALKKFKNFLKKLKKVVDELKVKRYNEFRVRGWKKLSFENP